MVSLTTGLLIPSIELVLGFVGSTIGVGICVIFPSLSYLNLNGKNANDKMVAKVSKMVLFRTLPQIMFFHLFSCD